jgi:hypothetical protein
MVTPEDADRDLIAWAWPEAIKLLCNGTSTRFEGRFDAAVLACIATLICRSASCATPA